MRGIVAKRLRKAAYGDNSIKQERKYQGIKRIKVFLKIIDGQRKKVQAERFQFINTDERKVYLGHKKLYYILKKEGLSYVPS